MQLASLTLIMNTYIFININTYILMYVCKYVRKYIFYINLYISKYVNKYSSTLSLRNIKLVFGKNS